MRGGRVECGDEKGEAEGRRGRCKRREKGNSLSKQGEEVDRL